MIAPLGAPTFKEALRYNPEKVALNFNLGRALNFLGRYDESEIYLERAKKGARASADVAIELSRSYLGKGKIKDGIFILEDFLKRFPGEIKVCIELAKVYDKFLRDDIRGREQMNRCLRVYESNPKLYDAYRLEIFDFLKR
jgi:tetratricopeptide (TPR) repeat protein